MRPRFRGMLFALVVAGTLSLSLVAGAFADRGDGHGDQNHVQQHATATSHGSGRSSDGNGQSKDHQGDVDDAITGTPTVTTTPGAATPTEVEEANGGNHGEEVSEVARQVTPGPGHGEEVSEVARENNGQETAGKDVDETPTATGTPATATATATETATAMSTATDTPTATGTPATATATATATGTPDDNDVGNDHANAAPRGKGLIVEFVTSLFQSVDQLFSSHS